MIELFSQFASSGCGANDVSGLVIVFIIPPSFLQIVLLTQIAY
jgi:hypothetical protein